MFLLNSRLGLFSAASFEAPLLPKLRGHFAEFLNNGSPVRLRILSSPTCVGLRYGRLCNILAPFLASVNSHASLLDFAPLHGPSLQCVLHYIADSPLGPALPSTGSCYPSVSVPRSHRRCRNLNLLSIAYDYCPRLRSRLTLRGRAFLRKP